MSKLIPVVVVVGALILATSRAASADEAPPEPRNRNTAFALSVGGTALSAGLVMVGMRIDSASLITVGLLSSLVTPSAGEFYASKFVTWGMAIRGASAMSLLAGLDAALECSFVGDSCHSYEDRAGTLIVAGAIGYAGGVLYDIATAGSAADDFNQRYHLRLAPAVLQTPSANTAVGIGIGGAF